MTPERLEEIKRWRIRHISPWYDELIAEIERLRVGLESLKHKGFSDRPCMCRQCNRIDAILGGKNK